MSFLVNSSLMHNRLAKLEGDWHEFESKALRKENERKDKEARRQAQKDASLRTEKEKATMAEKKRGPEGEGAEPQREAKRVQVAPPAPEPAVVEQTPAPVLVAISKSVEMTTN